MKPSNPTPPAAAPAAAPRTPTVWERRFLISAAMRQVEGEVDELQAQLKAAMDIIAEQGAALSKANKRVEELEAAEAKKAKAEPLTGPG